MNSQLKTCKNVLFFIGPTHGSTGDFKFFFEISTGSTQSDWSSNSLHVIKRQKDVVR